MPNHEDSCFTCRFFLPLQKGGGSCRRHAPRPSLEGQVVDRGGLMENAAVFPVVSPEDWCGEFELPAAGRPSPPVDATAVVSEVQL